MATASKSPFSWEDPFNLSAQLSDDERAVAEAARAYCQDKLASRVVEAFRHEKTDPAIFREMGSLGLLGVTIPEQYGGSGLNYVCYGLVAREVERVDSGYRSMMSVQSSLVMVPIFEFGNESTKQKYLPKLATGEYIGCFGLTEPDHGSDPASMITRARKVAGGYSLDLQQPVCRRVRGLGKRRRRLNSRFRIGERLEGLIRSSSSRQGRPQSIADWRNRDGQRVLP
jgi:glutaryl-CoA dehydrogenase